jgi:DNA-directed RNA polymerase subunit M/transcription elongation factor TFIIS
MLVVPDAGQIAASSVRPEEYTLRPAGEQAASRPGIVVECPVCRTRMDASEEQVGREVVCPDCGTAVLVRPPEAPVQGQRRAVQVEGYALLDESYQPAESRSTTHPIYIPVRCPLCDTLMHGTEDQVGQHLLCPDCYTPVVVPPPAEAPAKPSHRVDDEYQLQQEIERPAAAPRVEKKPLIPVVCRLCDARMYARPEQAGELICCPDCSTPVVVPQPEATTPRADMAATAAGEYGVGEAAERPEHHAPVNLRVARIEPGEQGFGRPCHDGPCSPECSASPSTPERGPAWSAWRQDCWSDCR